MENLAKALCKCQSELKDVFKGQKGYGYNYAPLDEVLKEIRPIATKNGISFMQSQTFGDYVVSIETIILHESGESYKTLSQSPFAKLKGMNEYQSIGSAITYLRRYALSAAFGIASDGDQDAHGEQDKKPTPSKATDKEKNAAKKELLERASNYTGVNFASDQRLVSMLLDVLSIPKTDESSNAKQLNDQYAVIAKWLNSVEKFESQLDILMRKMDGE